MSFILSLDQGTTSSRAMLFNERGEVVASVQETFEQHFPQPGWVEHDPEEIWESQLGAAVAVLSKAGIKASDLAAIGITNQRETTIVWERATGMPITNAIVWQDRRTAPMIDKLVKEGAAPMLQEKTGLVPDAYFSASKVQWILDHVEGARARTERGELAFGTVDTWLVHKLTGGRLHITDVSNASRTMLFNIHTLDWDDDLLALFSIPRSMLPEVRASSEVYGEVAGDLPLGKTVIAAIAGDQQAALFGQLCLDPSSGKNTYGTGCFMLVNTGVEPVRSQNRLLTTVAWTREQGTQYALEGSVFVGGALVQWLRDGLKIIRAAPEIEALANTVDDNGGVYLVPAFAGLGAPHWDPYARGALFGLTRGTTNGHIARAALEAISFQVADLVDAMDSDTGRALPELRVDGGAAANDTLMQIQADVLQRPIIRPAMTETTALGAAYLAGLAVGYWPSADALRENERVDRCFEPDWAADRVQELRARWNEAVQRSKGWA